MVSLPNMMCVNECIYVMVGVRIFWYHNYCMATLFTHIGAVSYRIDAVPRYATSYNARQLKAMLSNATSVPSSMMFFIYNLSLPHDSFLLQILTVVPTASTFLLITVLCPVHTGAQS